MNPHTSGRRKTPAKAPAPSSFSALISQACCTPINSLAAFALVVAFAGFVGSTAVGLQGVIANSSGDFFAPTRHVARAAKPSGQVLAASQAQFAKTALAMAKLVPARTLQPRVLGDSTTLDNNALCASIQAPQSLNQSDAFTATVIMKNNGSQAWAPGQYFLGSQSPQDNLWWGTSRARLTQTINPGDSATFSIPLKAPAWIQTYTYNFSWRMVDENVEWFGDTCSTHVLVIKPGSNTLAAHPAGSLIFDSSNNNTVYIVSSDGKGVIGFPTPEVFTSWGLNFNNIVSANSADPVANVLGIAPLNITGVTSFSSAQALAAAIQNALAQGSPPAASDFSVSPSQLSFTVTQTGPTTLVLTNNLSVNAAWQATSDSWLKVNPASGIVVANGYADLTVTANTASLSPGSYNSGVTVTYSSSGGIQHSVTIPVVLNLAAADQTPFGTVIASPSQLTFNYTSGSANPTGQNVALTASPTSLAWRWYATTSNNGNWLTASVNAGGYGGNYSGNGTIGVSVSPAGLAAGSYTGSITVAPVTAGQFTPLTINVALNVTAINGTNSISLSPSSLNFSYAIGSTNPSVQNVALTANPSSLVWRWYTSYNSGSNWITVVPSAGGYSGQYSGNNSLAVQVSPSGLAAGTYTGSVTVVPATSGYPSVFSSQTVNVTLVVTSSGSATANISVSPTALNFNAQQGSSPANQNLTISNTSNVAANYSVSVSPAASWFNSAFYPSNLTPKGTTGSSVTFPIAVNPSGYNLMPGTYTTNVVFSGNFDTITIPVTLTVTAGTAVVPIPTLTVYPLSFSIDGSPSYTITGAAVNSPITWSSTLTSPGSSTAVQKENNASYGQSTNGNGYFSAYANAFGCADIGTWSKTATVAGKTSAAVPITISDPLNMCGSSSAGSSVSLSPSSLNFAYTVGGPNPAGQNVTLTASPTNLLWHWYANTNSGGSWLSAAINAGGYNPNYSGNGTITVQVNPAGLAAGTYTGTVTVAPAVSGAANFTSQTLNITLVVTGASLGTSSVNPSVMNFASAQGANPSPQGVAVINSDSTKFISWTAAVSYGSGSGWLSVTPSSGTVNSGQASQGAIVAVNTAGLTPGNYTATINIAGNFTPSPLTVSVSLAVSATTAAVPLINGAQGYNPALANPYSVDSINANKFLILYGSFAGLKADGTKGDTVTLSGGGVGTILYDSSNQINVQLGALPPGTVSITVTDSNGTSAAHVVTSNQ